jgi:hypothetical protein
VQRKKLKKTRSRTDPRYILAGYYLAEVYTQAADRGFRPINLNVKNAAEFMMHLATGTPQAYEPKNAPVPPMHDRLTRAFLNIVWARTLKSDAHDRVDMERLAEQFLAKHRALFAEIVLTESGEFPNQKIPVGGHGKSIVLIPKATQP